MTTNFTIPWWYNEFGEEEVQAATEAVRGKHLSQGSITEEFEKKLGEALKVPHVVCTPSGSMALLLALMVSGVGPGDEVIVPDRTWVATAHAPLLLGAKVVLVDVEPHRPIIDVSQIEKRITKKTKAIIPVHMNGRGADIRAINEIGKKHGIHVIEDAAQAIGSRNRDGYLGTQSRMGCFSLSVAKTIATGQGGFIVTHDAELASLLRMTRNNSVHDVKDPKKWTRPGFNFKFTDVQAAMGLVQLRKLPARIRYLREIYQQYTEGLAAVSELKLIPVNLEAGEVPVYNEFLADRRDEVMGFLAQKGIDTRLFYPNLHDATYMDQGEMKFPNARKYGDHGVYLPSGPSQSKENVQKVIECLLSRK